MADFTRSTQRFACAGLTLNAPGDATPPGKYLQLLNVRSYEEGTLTVRAGTSTVATLGSAGHTLFRLNDPTPLNGGISAVRLYGEGGNLHLGAIGNAAPSIVDAGYSGNPLTICSAEPIGTVQPYAYVADSVRMRKVNVEGTVYPIGIAPPILPPTAVVGAPGLQVLENFDGPTDGFWLSTGAGSPIGFQSRLLTQFSPATTTTISAILYDAGSTGNCLIVPAMINNITAGTVLDIDGEDVLVQEIKPAIESTTVAGAIQDPATGLWSIQPTGGLGTGIITELQSQSVFDTAAALAYLKTVHPDYFAETPTFDPQLYQQSIAALTALRSDPQYYTQFSSEVTLGSLDFPAGALVNVGGIVTKVLSIQTGLDGIVAFQCELPGAPALGAAITGQAALRCYTVAPHSIGGVIACNVAVNTITAIPPSVDPTSGVSTYLPTSGGIATTTVGSTSPVTPTGGGGPTTPAALQIPDHTSTVTTAKAQALAAGYDLTTPCGIAQVCILVAQALQGEGCGLFRHSSGGMTCANTAYGSIEADAVMYVSGQIVYILANPTGRDGPAPINVPEFSIQMPDGDAAQRFISLGPITNPLPTVPGSSTTPGTPAPPNLPPPPPGTTLPPLTFDVGTINGNTLQPDDRLHIALWFNAAISSIIKVQILFDVDAQVNNFTQNYYVYEADGNSLSSAIQSTPGGATATQPAATLSNQVPVTAVQSNTVTQLPLGANQWIDLTWKLRDMLRVGTDESRGFSDLAAIGVLITIDSTQGNLIAQYGSIYLEGGDNPDTGSGSPYRYFYRFRSSITGARSNPSPEIRPQSITPVRQTVTITPPSVSGDPQADLVDWFRVGGQLTNPVYIGSSNPGAAFVDNFADETVVGGENLRFDLFQPWPTTDQPRKGSCTTAGSVVQWVSGDTFNPSWAPGSQILINGLAFTIAMVTSSTILETVESVGALVGAPFVLQAPTLQGQPLPILFGPWQGLWFAVGDPNNPGALYWTNPNDPDSTNDTNFLQVTDSSVPLQHGFVRDGQIFVWSTNDLYRIVPTGGATQPFYAQKTECGRGLWSPWAWCSTPQGEFFLAEDGIYLTVGGSVAQSVSDADLYPLFPHDGVQGVPVRGVAAPNMTVPTGLRLQYVDGSVYFDYAV